MRYLVGFVYLVALLMVPLSVSAQASEEGDASEPNVVEAVPSQGSASRDAALQLTVDHGGVEVAPGYPPELDEIHEMELRVKRARIGLGVSIVAMTVLGPLMCLGAAGGELNTGKSLPGLWAACGVVTVGGLGGTVASGILLHRRKRDRDTSRTAHTGAPRRGQRDPAGSQLMF
jgi:hypothetical protein